MNKKYAVIGIIFVIIGVVSFIGSSEFYRVAFSNNPFDYLNSPIIKFFNGGYMVMNQDRVIFWGDVIRYGLGVAVGAAGLVLLLAGLLKKSGGST